MKESFYDALCDLAQENPNIEFIKADAGFNAKYQNNFSKQYLNIGISEQNMIGVAAGMAFSGKTVFAYSLVDFSSLRVLDQIRVDLGYNCADVKVVSCGTGFDYCDDGVSHIAVDDISALRAVPNLIIFSPCDPYEAYAVTKAAATVKQPCFIRLGRGGEPELHKAEIVNYRIGDVLELHRGKEIAILVTGSIAREALNTAEKLKEKGIEVGVYSFPTIAPLNKSFVENIMKSAQLVITLEEHSLEGGFGAAIAEVVADLNIGNCASFVRLGVESAFASSKVTHEDSSMKDIFHLCTPAKYFRKVCGLASENIEAIVLEYLTRKDRANEKN